MSLRDKKIKRRVRLRKRGTEKCKKGHADLQESGAGERPLLSIRNGRLWKPKRGKTSFDKKDREWSPQTKS